VHRIQKHLHLRLLAALLAALLPSLPPQPLSPGGNHFHGRFSQFIE
jgi:hypothetical protein